MNLDDILSQAGKYKKPKRVGRGESSGVGKTSGRGHKGYGARSGAKRRLGYEGGQNPVLARIPKRGFNNANFRKDYQIVNLAELQECFEDGATVNGEALVDAGLIDNAAGRIKILGDGELSKKLNVTAGKFSASAKAAIENADGSVEEVSIERKYVRVRKAKPAKAPKPAAKSEQAAQDDAETETKE